tara:strand:- start:689 stop:5203 length:4515 start_codon:yes stop_codon:yes gene_type:complete
MAVRNPFDQIILDDPAYAEETKIDPQAGKKLVRDIYGLVVGEQDPFAKEKLDRELSVALAQKEAGLPVDPNKSFVTSAERQDPVLGPALDKFGFKPMGLGEFGERTLEFLYRDQEKARSKQLRGEELTLGEKIAANPFMAALDAADFTGLLALATKGGIKLSVKGLQTLNNLRSQGASKEVINQVMTSQFPDDAQKIGLVYYQSNRPPVMETSQIMKAPDDGGAGGMSPASLENLKRGASASQESLYSGYRQALDKFRATNPDIFNAGTFYDFLKQEGVPLTISETNKKSTLNHLKRAIKYLDPNAQLQMSADYKPWMLAAENLLKNKDKMTSRALYKDLKDLGFNISQNRINEWARSGKNFQDQNLIAKVDASGSIPNEVRNQKVEAVNKLIKDLESGNIDKGQGFKAYTVEIPYENTKINMKNLMANLNRDDSMLLTEAIGKENINKLNMLMSKPEGEIANIFTQYIPITGKKIDNEYATGLKKLKEAFRDGTFGNAGKGDFEQVMDAYGIVKKTDPNFNKDINRERVEQLIFDLESRNTKKELDAYKTIYNNSVELSNYTIPKYKEVIMSSPELQTRLLEEYRKFDPDADLEKAIIMTGKAFGGHLSHIYRISDFAGPLKDFKKGMSGLATVPNLVRVNYGIENLALQRTAENVIDNSISKIKNALNKNDMKLVNQHLDKIKKYNDLLTEKGMAAYRRIKKENLTPQVVQLINMALDKQVAGTIAKAGVEDNVQKKFNDILLGSETPQTLQEMKMRFDNLMNYYLENPNELKVSLQNPELSQEIIDTMPETPYMRKGFLNLSGQALRDATGFKKGGPVKMAIGGDPLTNINQQQFADDPAFQGQDFFKQAVESGNLQAFNPVNIFKGLGKVKAMLTPNKVTDVPTMPKATDPIEDFTVPPPMKPKVNPGDFPFQSYLLGAITDPNAPKNAAPNEWMNFLAKGRNVSESELNDSGISAYLEDSVKFLPGQKVSQETLVDVFEKSPIANIEIFVKKSDVPDRPDTDRDVVNFNALQGRPEHKNAGNVRIDEAGENYREILINAPELPGQKQPYFNTTHYSKEPNILAFARVADYKNVQGDNVAVIQELQTDYLTKLKKEQERLGALVQNIENRKRFLQEKLMRDPTDAYFGDQLRALETQYPNARVEFLKNTNLTKPSKPLILETMAPEIQESLAELQTKIQAIANQNKFQVVDPNYQNKIVDLQLQGREQFNKLFELNRQQNFDDQLKDVFVTSESRSDDILRSAQDQDIPAQYRGKKLETFPSIPFNKGPDWIDMMLKATIQDARSNGINKIAIMPSEFVNMRWGKDTSGPAAEKFKTIYDKIAVQQMKNIAKKYGGNVEIEQVIDKTKGKFGYKYINKGAGGEEILDTTDDLDKTVIKPKDYFDARIMKELKTYGDNSILLRREIAPNQFSEFIVRPDDERTTIGYKLETPPDGFDEDNIIRIIQEYNPSETPMFVLTLPEETSKQGPMFLFRKKDGGKIASDGLVSITDIYGEYNGRKV